MHQHRYVADDGRGGVKCVSRFKGNFGEIQLQYYSMNYSQELVIGKFGELDGFRIRNVILALNYQFMIVAAVFVSRGIGWFMAGRECFFLLLHRAFRCLA